MSTDSHSQPYKAKPRIKWLTAADASPVISRTHSNSSDYSISTSSPRYQPYSTSRASGSPQDAPVPIPMDQNHPESMNSHHSSLNITIPPIPAHSSVHCSSPETPATLVDSPISPKLSFLLDSPYSPSTCSALFDPHHPFSSSFVIPPPSHGRIRKPKRSEDEILQENLDNVADILAQIGTTFGSLGDFLMLVFWSRKKTADTDLRQTNHQRAVSRLLSGHNNITVAHVVDAIYNHHNAQPLW